MLLMLKPLLLRSIVRNANLNYQQYTKSVKAFSISAMNAVTTDAVIANAVAMKDEYGAMDSSGETYTAPRFKLESGIELLDVHVRYNCFGQLNDKKDNVIVVCHALTGNSRLDQWWGSLLGNRLAFDTSKYLVVCANVLGSCYGTTGPNSIDPATGMKYGNAFPDVTIRDTVSLHMEMVRNSIGASSIECVVGGSMGGMQALEWTLIGKKYVKSAIVIGCGAHHTAWQIGISETQRQAIYADPNWNNGNIDINNPPSKGLAVARQIAMISYRTAKAYHNKFGREVDSSTGHFQTRKYLEYQGIKFLDRFDSVTYVKLTEQMDSHDIGRDRGGIESALNSIDSRVMVMGIDSDILYPIYEQEQLSKHIKNSQFYVIKSNEGHDGFLLEQSQGKSLKCRYHYIYACIIQ